MAVNHPTGPLVLLLLLISALGICHFLLLPATPLLFIPLPFIRRCYRSWISLAAAMWLCFGAFLIEKLGGVKIKISTRGNASIYTGLKRGLIVANHFTRIDWVFLWSFALRTKAITAYRVILKASLRSFPWWGWGMSQNLFIFIDRGSNNRLKALEQIQKICRYLINLGTPNSLIIFPEGTDLSVSNQEKDREFCVKNKLEPYKHVLHPRTGAFITSIKAMREQLDCVYDLTMGYVPYTPGERPSEVSVFLKGRWPREVHIDVNQINIQDVPSTDADLDQFIKDRFDEKEKLLHAFCKDGSFQASSTYPPPNTSYVHLVHAVSCLSVGALMAGVVYFANLNLLWFWSYTAMGLCTYVLVTYLFHGFDSIELFLPLFGMGAAQRHVVTEKEA